MRPHRPFLVGLVCWVLILSGSIGGYREMRQLGTDHFQTVFLLFPYPAPVAETIFFGTMVLWIFCGISLYEGQGWARYLYLPGSIPFAVQTYLATAGIPHTDVHYALSWFLFYKDVACYFLSALILFLPKARRFFHPPQYLDE